jgi:hypothetical protein
MGSHDAATRSLEALGLTELEARCYTFLQANGAATGYAVARGVGRQTANVYKALDSLRARGAIEVEEGRPRVCRAVPPQELLAALDRGFARRRAAAAQSLARLRGSDDAARVYHLQNPEQVFERFRTLLADTAEIALLDLFPGCAERLAGDLEAAAERDVLVVVKLYRRRDLGRVVTLVHPEGEATMARWRGEWANGVFDGRSHLLALLDGGLSSVHQAVWSASEWISCVYHSAFVHELRQVTRRGAARGRWEDERVESAPGMRRLIERLASVEAEQSES